MWGQSRTIVLALLLKCSGRWHRVVGSYLVRISLFEWLFKPFSCPKIFESEISLVSKRLCTESHRNNFIQTSWRNCNPFILILVTTRNMPSTLQKIFLAITIQTYHDLFNAIANPAVFFFFSFFFMRGFPWRKWRTGDRNTKTEGKPAAISFIRNAFPHTELKIDPISRYASSPIYLSLTLSLALPSS